MNALEMQIEFERLLYTSNPEYSVKEKLDTDEIFAYLNISQLRVMKGKYFPSPNILENIKTIEGNMGDLRNMIKREEAITPGSPISINYGYLVDLPIDFLHYIRSDSAILRAAYPVISLDSIVPNKLIEYREIDKVSTNAFNRPIIRKPCVLFEENDKMIIFRDAYTTLGDIYLTYLRTPLSIALGGSNDCELAEYLHEEVVAMAVDIFRREKYLLISKDSRDDSRGNA